MIKFRYKRKESSSGTANTGTSVANAAATNTTNAIASNKNSNNNNDANVNNLNASTNPIGEHKSIDVKTAIDAKTNSLKRDVTPKAKIDEIKSVKTKSVSDDEYLADCIRAVVVSATI